MKARRVLTAMVLSLTLTLPPSVVMTAPMAAGTGTFCFIFRWFPPCR